MAEFERDIQVGQVFRIPRPAGGRNKRNSRFPQDEEMTYVFVRGLGVLKEHDKGWCREVNVVQWNGCQPKLDIRDWNEEHDRMGRGITLSVDEARTLKDTLARYDFQEMTAPPQAQYQTQAPPTTQAQYQTQAPTQAPASSSASAQPPASAWAAV